MFCELIIGNLPEEGRMTGDEVLPPPVTRLSSARRSAAGPHPRAPDCQMGVEGTFLDSYTVRAIRDKEIFYSAN